MCRKNHDFDDYYFTIYTLDDELITGFDDIETLAKFFNMKLKYVLQYLKNNTNFRLNDRLVKVVIIKKELENEIIVRRR